MPIIKAGENPLELLAQKKAALHEAVLHGRVDETKRLADEIAALEALGGK